MRAETMTETVQKPRWHELLARPMTEGILRACGVHQVTYQAFYEVTGVTQTARRAMLEEVRVLAAAF